MHLISKRPTRVYKHNKQIEERNPNSRHLKGIPNKR